MLQAEHFRRGFCAWQLVASLFLHRHPDGRDVRNGKEIENKGKLRDRKRGNDGSANANKLDVMDRSDRAVVSLSLSRKATDREERIRCMPQIGSNIYAIGMITALRDYVRLLRAIPMLTLLYHHQHPPPPLFIPRCLPQSTSTSTSSTDLPYKRQIRVIKRPLAGHMHCSRWPCNFRLEDLPDDPLPRVVFPAFASPRPTSFFLYTTCAAMFFQRHNRL